MTDLLLALIVALLAVIGWMLRRFGDRLLAIADDHEERIDQLEKDYCALTGFDRRRVPRKKGGLSHADS